MLVCPVQFPAKHSHTLRHHCCHYLSMSSQGAGFTSWTVLEGGRSDLHAQDIVQEYVPGALVHAGFRSSHSAPLLDRLYPHPYHWGAHPAPASHAGHSAPSLASLLTPRDDIIADNACDDAQDHLMGTHHPPHAAAAPCMTHHAESHPGGNSELARGRPSAPTSKRIRSRSASPPKLAKLANIDHATLLPRTPGPYPRSPLTPSVDELLQEPCQTTSPRAQWWRLPRACLLRGNSLTGATSACLAQQGTCRRVLHCMLAYRRRISATLVA